ncbi:hypothetical protein NP493_1402g01018 [Ridgeia piscesae]|uniref:Uncharacterized protein n=1 Tax=Ridgeia piscesae TaxID=27915 RepID=A0AAD9NBY4_RIDPI|nr:hypothetical protein NP493_1402g01018 [Ridgeia piscesae]
MYLPTKMCASRPYTESFTWWIHGRLGRRVQRVIPVYTSHKMELGKSKRRTRYGITLSTC